MIGVEVCLTEGPIGYRSRMDTLTESRRERLDAIAASLLTGARRVRILDDAIRVAREELDELGGMIARLPSVTAVPSETSLCLREVVARLDRLEEERRAVLADVPDRV